MKPRARSLGRRIADRWVRTELRRCRERGSDGPTVRRRLLSRFRLLARQHEIRWPTWYRAVRARIGRLRDFAGFPDRQLPLFPGDS